MNLAYLLVIDWFFGYLTMHFQLQSLYSIELDGEMIMYVEEVQ
jgi:hypothetical protein